MNFRDVGWSPSDPQNRGYLKNPNGTMPYPTPDNMPVGMWDGGHINLQVAVPPGGSAWWRQAEYRSPIFDLRPDLRSMMAGEQRGIPIWRQDGLNTHGKLRVVIDGINVGNGTNGLEVEVREFTSPNRVDQLVQVTDNVDVSDCFVTRGRSATLLEFYALGGGSPIRFWQVRFEFRWFNVLAASPLFNIYSAYY